MKKLIFLLALMLTPSAFAQVKSCSTSTPCTTVSWTGSSAAATVQTNSAGMQIAGPITATVYKCVGAPTSCTLAALTAYIASPTTPNVWTTAGTITQTTVQTSWQDNAVAYGELLNYSIGQIFIGSLGGVAAAPSPLAAFAMPSAPNAAPSSAGAPTITLKTN